MFKKLKQTDRSGFTIIEVMIVLAIAGVIMLVVFMAVPALQRSQRNTQRKNDVSSLLSAIQTAVDNQGGELPTANGTVATEFPSLDWNPGYYTTSTNVNYVYSATAQQPADPASTDKIVVANFAECGTGADVEAAASTTGTTATSRDLIVLYDIEGGGGKAVEQCVQM